MSVVLNLMVISGVLLEKNAVIIMLFCLHSFLYNFFYKEKKIILKNIKILVVIIAIVC